jgi:hypothetical protein
VGQEQEQSQKVKLSLDAIRPDRRVGASASEDLIIALARSYRLVLFCVGHARAGGGCISSVVLGGAPLWPGAGGLYARPARG